MKKTKTCIAFLTAALLLLSTAACAGGGASSEAATTPAAPAATQAPAADAPADDAASEAAASGEGQTIQLWHIHTGANRADPIAAGAAAFEAETGAKVEITVLENDPYKTKLRTVISSGDAPDVFHSWGGGWLKAFVDEGLVVDITEPIQGWKDQLSEAGIGMVTFNDKVWASPIISSSTPLYYNKAMFDEYGLTLPTTWAEMETVASTLIDNGIIPFAEANLTKWPGAQHFVLLSMRIGGPDIFQKAVDGVVTFEDPAFIKAGEMLQKMVDDGWFPDGVNALNWDTGDSRQMMYSGQAAMILQTSGFVSTCKDENMDFYNNNLAIGSYPAVDGGVGVVTDVLAGSNAFSVSSNSANPELAIRLLEVMSTNDEVQQGLADGGTLGAKGGLTYTDPPIQAVADSLVNATFQQNFIDQTLDPEMGEKHKDTCQALFGKTMTPAEAAAEMQALYDSLY
jgi:raffinose/stachyose/melibiose transport system substrate-binding protein